MIAGAYDQKFQINIYGKLCLNEIKCYAKIRNFLRSSNFKSDEFILEAKFVLESDSIENIVRTKK